MITTDLFFPLMIVFALAVASMVVPYYEENNKVYVITDRNPGDLNLAAYIFSLLFIMTTMLAIVYFQTTLARYKFQRFIFYFLILSTITFGLQVGDYPSRSGKYREGFYISIVTFILAVIICLSVIFSKEPDMVFNPYYN